MAKTVHTSLLIIGGAKDKVGRATVLRGFVRLAGARSARIVIIPSASSLPDEAAHTYNTVFGRLGAPEVVVVSPPSRRSAASERVSGHGQCHRRLHDGGQPAQAQAALGRHAPDRGHLPSARVRLRRGWCVGRSLDHEPVHDLPGCEQGDPRSAPASSRPDWACCPASSSTSILMNARAQAVPERLTAAPPAPRKRHNRFGTRTTRTNTNAQTGRARPSGDQVHHMCHQRP